MRTPRDHFGRDRRLLPWLGFTTSEFSDRVSSTHLSKVEPCGPDTSAAVGRRDSNEIHSLRDTFAISREQPGPAHDEVLGAAIRESSEVPERSLENGPSNGERTPTPNQDESEHRSEPDALGDSIRTYLKQLGRLPRLTREQEIEISQRIEIAEQNFQTHLNRFGFISRVYLDT